MRELRRESCGFRRYRSVGNTVGMLPFTKPGAKRARPKALSALHLLPDDGKIKRQRFWPCPVCNRSFPLFRLDDHVNDCLDAPDTPVPSVIAADSAHTPRGNAAACSDVPPLSPFPPLVPPLHEYVALSSVKGDIRPNAFPASLVPRGCHSGKEGQILVKSDLSSPNDFDDDKATLSLLGSQVTISRSREVNASGSEQNAGPEEIETMEEMRDGTGRALDRPPAGFKLFQRQVQSQARLCMFRKFSSSTPLQRKPTVTVLQPGMVLMRNWLELELQQKLVDESQGVAHLFHRPTTSGGGKYHIYSMCWGPHWDAKAHRYVSKGPEQLLPLWMFELSQKVAKEAQEHTPVYPPKSKFAPDVGLVNFYPVKANELGVVGLGGHQDLDDSATMPVVSLSVGDTMTFFYRRLPPLSRRKSGISISVDKKAARSCEDGDAAHNREHQILLGSGDVLVFGGESRLVFHGTRLVQPGTRPPGLHMVPGRLNFTFRQTSRVT